MNFILELETLRKKDLTFLGLDTDEVEGEVFNLLPFYPYGIPNDSRYLYTDKYGIHLWHSASKGHFTANASGITTELPESSQEESWRDRPLKDRTSSVDRILEEFAKWWWGQQEHAEYDAGLGGPNMESQHLQAQGVKSSNASGVAIPVGTVIGVGTGEGSLLAAGARAGVAGAAAATVLTLSGDQTAAGAEAARGKRTGAIVYRVHGGLSGPLGHSWTPQDPRSHPLEFRNLAGLPNVNTGEFLTTGTLISTEGVILRPALPLDGNSGGWPELLVPSPGNQIQIIKLNEPLPPPINITNPGG